MSIYETANELEHLLLKTLVDIREAKMGNRKAAQKVRTSTIKLNKIGLRFRRESVDYEEVLKGKFGPGRVTAQEKEIFKYIPEVKE